MWCIVIICDIISRDAMQCHVMLHQVMWCNVKSLWCTAMCSVMESILYVLCRRLAPQCDPPAETCNRHCRHVATSNSTRGSRQLVETLSHLSFDWLYSHNGHNGHTSYISKMVKHTTMMLITKVSYHRMLCKYQTMLL